MMHLTADDKSLLVGDVAAETLLRYAALLGRTGSADTVHLHAIGPDGSEVVVVLLLNSGTSLIAETTDSSLPDPQNDDAVAYMTERLSAFELDDRSLRDLFGSEEESRP